MTYKYSIDAKKSNKPVNISVSEKQNFGKFLIFSSSNISKSKC